MNCAPTIWRLRGFTFRTIRAAQALRFLQSWSGRAGESLPLQIRTLPRQEFLDRHPWPPDATSVKYIVEYGSRSFGNKVEEFEELQDAKDFADCQIEQDDDVDFVTIYGPDGQEIAQE